MDKEQYIKTEEGATAYFSDEAMTVLHREDGPAVEHADGSKLWYINGVCHRDDGPAGEWDGGDKFWYINGKLHREGAPAVEWADGSGEWYIDGKRHREDGPAMTWAHDSEGWYFINGERVNEDGTPHLCGLPVETMKMVRHTVLKEHRYN